MMIRDLTHIPIGYNSEAPLRAERHSATPGEVVFTDVNGVLLFIVEQVGCYYVLTPGDVKIGRERDA